LEIGLGVFPEPRIGRNNHVGWEAGSGNTWGDIAGIRAAGNRPLEDVGSVIEVNFANGADGILKIAPQRVRYENRNASQGSASGGWWPSTVHKISAKSVSAGGRAGRVALCPHGSSTSRYDARHNRCFLRRFADRMLVQPKKVRPSLLESSRRLSVS